MENMNGLKGEFLKKWKRITELRELDPNDAAVWMRKCCQEQAEYEDWRRKFDQGVQFLQRHGVPTVISEAEANYEVPRRSSEVHERCEDCEKIDRILESDGLTRNDVPRLICEAVNGAVRKHIESLDYEIQYYSIHGWDPEDRVENKESPAQGQDASRVEGQGQDAPRVEGQGEGAPGVDQENPDDGWVKLLIKIEGDGDCSQAQDKGAPSSDQKSPAEDFEQFSSRDMAESKAQTQSPLQQGSTCVVS